MTHETLGSNAEMGGNIGLVETQHVRLYDEADPFVLESGESRSRGRLSKQGSPYLRWALLQACPTDRSPAFGSRLEAQQGAGFGRDTFVVRVYPVKQGLGTKRGTFKPSSRG